MLPGLLSNICSTRLLWFACLLSATCSRIYTHTYTHLLHLSHSHLLSSIKPRKKEKNDGRCRCRYRATNVCVISRRRSGGQTCAQHALNICPEFLWFALVWVWVCCVCLAMPYYSKHTHTHLKQFSNVLRARAVFLSWCERIYGFITSRFCCVYSVIVEKNKKKKLNFFFFQQCTQLDN